MHKSLSTSLQIVMLRIWRCKFSSVEQKLRLYGDGIFGNVQQKLNVFRPHAPRVVVFEHHLDGGRIVVFNEDAASRLYGLNSFHGVKVYMMHRRSALVAVQSQAGRFYTAVQCNKSTPCFSKISLPL